MSVDRERYEHIRGRFMAWGRERKDRAAIRLLDESIEIRRQAVISTIENEFFTEDEKRATSARLADAIVNKVAYQNPATWRK